MKKGIGDNNNYIQQRCGNYKKMVKLLVSLIQDYLVLSDDNTHRGALKSLELVKSSAQLHEDNRICIWLEEVWKMHPPPPSSGDTRTGRKSLKFA